MSLRIDSRRLLGLSLAVVVLLTSGTGAAARSHGNAHASLRADTAVVVESHRKQTLAALHRGATGWRIVSRFRVARGIRSIAWRPGGRQLVVSTAGGNLSNELRMIDLANGGQRMLATARRGDPAAFFGSLAWSPDGRRIAASRSTGLYGGEIDVLDASDGSLVRAYRAVVRYDSSLAWSPDGRTLYFARQGSQGARPKLQRLVVATGTIVPFGGISGLDPSVRADGAVSFTAADEIRVLRKGRTTKVAGSRKGDRLATWTAGGTLLLAERPSPNCPRYIGPPLCSHVVVLTRSGSVHRLLEMAARNPATR